MGLSPPFINYPQKVYELFFESLNALRSKGSRSAATERRLTFQEGSDGNIPKGAYICAIVLITLFTLITIGAIVAVLRDIFNSDMDRLRRMKKEVENEENRCVCGKMRGGDPKPYDIHDWPPFIIYSPSPETERGGLTRQLRRENTSAETTEKTVPVVIVSDQEKSQN